MSRAFPLATAACVLIAGACSTFGSGGDGTAPAPEAGDDARNDDASAEASPSDGAADARADCAEPLDLDVDFDTDTALVDWERRTSNGSVEITSMLPDGAAPPSAPNALHALVSLPDGGSGTASIQRTFPFVPTRLRITFALYVAEATPFAELGCTVRVTGADAGPAILDVIAYGGALETRHVDTDGGGSGTLAPIGDLPAGGFTNLELVLTTDADAGVAQGTVRRLGLDGIPTASADVGTYGLPADATGLEIECGVPYADFGGTTVGSGAVDVALDDIAIHGCIR